MIICTDLVFVFTYCAYSAYSAYSTSLSCFAYFNFNFICSAYCAYSAYSTYLSHFAYFKFSGYRRSISTTPAKRHSKEVHIVDEENTSGSAKKRRLMLTVWPSQKSGRVSISWNNVNAKYDASYRSLPNTQCRVPDALRAPRRLQQRVPLSINWCKCIQRG